MRGVLWHFKFAYANSCCIMFILAYREKQRERQRKREREGGDTKALKILAAMASIFMSQQPNC